MQALAHPCVFPIALRALVALFPLFGVYDGFILMYLATPGCAWGKAPGCRHRSQPNIVDAARGTGPSASLDFGRTRSCILSDPTWIRTLKEFWWFLLKVPPQIDFPILLGLIWALVS